MPKPPPDRPRAIIVHSLDHAKAAVAAARGGGVVLLSAPGAAATLGAAAFRAMIEAAREDRPEAEILAVLDCADLAGRALEALHEGVAALRFTGPEDVAGKIADIAAQCGAVLYTDDPPALDLLDEEDPVKACREWLAD